MFIIIGGSSASGSAPLQRQASREQQQPYRRSGSGRTGVPLNISRGENNKRNFMILTWKLKKMDNVVE